MVKLFDVLTKCFQTNMNTVHIFTDTVLFLSYLSKNVDEVCEFIKKDGKFVPALQAYIQHHSKDANVIQLLSECVAHLPIEDLVLYPV